MDAVVTVGRDVSRDPLHAMVAKLSLGKISQGLLMARAAIVISHGGAGTMLAAGVAGVPQIVIPSFADQFDNTDAFVGAGVALAVEEGDVLSDAIADRLRLLLEDSTFEHRAGVLSRGFDEMPSAESTATRLATLV